MKPYWTSHDGRHVLYHGDCLAVLPHLPSVDAVVTDPPYGTQDLGRGYGRRQNHDIGDGRGRVIANDCDLSMCSAALPLAANLIPCGWMLVFFAPRKTPAFCTATANLNWFGELVWDKAQPGLGYHIRYCHESIAVFQVGTPPRPPDALLSVQRDTSADISDHPHAKPVKLIESLTTWAAPHSRTVLDPFTGSGTTGVACIRTGRRFIGVELEERYCAIAVRRMEAELAQPMLIAPEAPRETQQELL